MVQQTQQIKKVKHPPFMWAQHTIFFLNSV